MLEGNVAAVVSEFGLDAVDAGGGLAIGVEVGQAKAHADVGCDLREIGVDLGNPGVCGREVLVHLHNRFVDLGVRNVLRAVVVHHMKHDGNQKILVRAGKRLRGIVSGVVFERQPSELLASHPLGMGELHVFALPLVDTPVLCLTNPTEHQQCKEWPNDAEGGHAREGV